MGLLGILLGLVLLVWVAFRGWSVLLLAPAAALVAAALSREPLLASWTQTFMSSAATFLAQFFPLFLLGALFGKLMEDSGSGLGDRHLHDAAAGRAARHPGGGAGRRAGDLRRRQPVCRVLRSGADGAGAVSLGRDTAPPDAGRNRARHLHLYDVRPARHARDPECDSDAVLRHHPVRRAGARHNRVRHHAGLRHGRAEAAARRAGEGFGEDTRDRAEAAADDPLVRERATTAREFDPAEIRHGQQGAEPPPIALAMLPLVVVIVVNLMMSLVVLPRLDLSFLAEERWGGITLADVGGVWAVVTALAAAVVVLIVVSFHRLPALRASMDAGANASVLPALSVASLVGFGAVVASLPAFAAVRDWVLAIDGGPLVSLAVATNVLAALTGSAAGGLTIALDALGPTYMQLAAAKGIDPALMHRVAVMGAGTLDSLPHNGAVVTLLAVCGSTHRASYLDIVMVGIVGAVIALAIVLGTTFGSF